MKNILLKWYFEVSLFMYGIKSNINMMIVEVSLYMYGIE